MAYKLDSHHKTGGHSKKKIFHPKILTMFPRDRTYDQESWLNAFKKQEVLIVKPEKVAVIEETWFHLI
jgi:hypothetical protein